MRQEAAAFASELTLQMAISVQGQVDPSQLLQRPLKEKGGCFLGSLSPLEDVKMGAGQPHEVLATMCKHTSG